MRAFHLAVFCLSVTCSACVGKRVYHGAYAITGTASVRASYVEASSLRADGAKDSGSISLQFEDERAIFGINVVPIRIAVRITNPAKQKGPDNTLFVLLEDAEIVYSDGTTRPLVQFVTNTSRKIPAGKSKLYWLQPSGDQLRGLFGGSTPLYATRNPHEVEDVFQSHIGERFRLRLPVLIGEVEYLYEFDLQVTDIESYGLRPHF